MLGSAVPNLCNYMYIDDYICKPPVALLSTLHLMMILCYDVLNMHVIAFEIWVGQNVIHFFRKKGAG